MSIHLFYSWKKIKIKLSFYFNNISLVKSIKQIDSALGGYDLKFIINWDLVEKNY